MEYLICDFPLFNNLTFNSACNKKAATPVAVFMKARSLFQYKYNLIALFLEKW